MIKVLHYIPGFEFGGIESRLLDWYRYIDKNNIQFDVLKLTLGVNKLLEEIQSLGGKIYTLPKFNIRNILAYQLELRNFFHKHDDYHVVHVHGASTGYFILKEAARHKIEKRVLHSRTTGHNPGEKNVVIKNFMNKIAPKYATHYFACSLEAGAWLFSSSILNSERFKVIRNGIEINKFRFNINKRIEYRKLLNLEENIVIGNVARFSSQKNHPFLIAIFKELIKKDQRYKLLLVGEGPLRGEIEQLIIRNDLESYILLVGHRNNVQDYMQAMDFFLFPTYFEGFGTVLIEAQASGLRCFCSESVPKSVAVTDLIEFISIKRDANYWAQKTHQMIQGDYNRKDMGVIVANAGYDVFDTAKWLQDFYQDKV